MLNLIVWDSVWPDSSFQVFNMLYAHASTKVRVTLPLQYVLLAQRLPFVHLVAAFVVRCSVLYLSQGRCQDHDMIELHWNYCMDTHPHLHVASVSVLEMHGLWALPLSDIIPA